VTNVVKHISVSINRSAEAVYEFASNPENFPRWVVMMESITRGNNVWLAQTKAGEIEITWPEQNEYYVLDHDVTFPDGNTVTNSMRIIKNDDGCEFVFTLFQRPGVSASEFEDDAKLVLTDLLKLKSIMERL
jgi:uncharacterized protein YndB with AHSA1/START domain